uniref:Protein odr-4 homolog n=1 Tax=Sinocyclocheilus grahami TaxID=75366 RepID=A0A672T0K1_SINGR
MGRSYFVEETVEEYLVGLQTAPGSCLTGLLAGQSSPQRDFVVLAVQTPYRESEGQPKASRGVSPLDDIDVGVGHRTCQVSRMLPGGLCILGLFLVTPPELSKDAQNALKRLVFAMDKYITKGRLWELSEEDVTDQVTLHICSKTKKTVCKTFDVKDPQSSAKPADWKYQTGVSSSWPMLICSVEVDILVSSDITDKCMKDGLRRWAEQIEAAYCLINGRQALDDSELSSGQVKTSLLYQCHRNSQSWMSASSTSSALVQVCSGSVKVRGVVYCRAYIHNNKPKARHAAQVIRRGIINTVCSRVEMFLEDLLINEGSHKGTVQALPRRVFAPVPISGLSVCDYMFPDESTADVAERLKEMLDCETPEEDIDTGLEGNQCMFPILFSDVSGSEITDSPSDDSSKHVISEVQAENPKNQKAPQYYAGKCLTLFIIIHINIDHSLFLYE